MSLLRMLIDQATTSLNHPHINLDTSSPTLSIDLKGNKFYNKQKIFVLQDLPQADAIKKRSLHSIMKLSYEKGQRVAFRNGKLYIDGKEYRTPPS